MEKEIYKIDAAGRAPGRVASEMAKVLMGKNKADYLSYKDNDVIIEVSGVNKMKITGKKMEQHTYYSYSGYAGGLKRKLMKDVTPEFVLRHAVFSMLPRNGQIKARMKRIKFV